MNKYPIIVFWSEEDGVWIADAPDLRHCSAHGATPEEAVRELSTAMTLWIEAVKAAGEPCRNRTIVLLSTRLNDPMPITIYGIKNCDTMKKARAWLEQHRVDHAFHDYKSAGIDKERLERWSKKVGWETLINRSGLTFKKLPDKDKEGLTETKALALMLKQPSMIKRPVLDLGGGKLVVGFKPETYADTVPH